MKKNYLVKHKYLFIFTIIILGGCYSFNTVSIVDNKTVESVKENVTKQTQSQPPQVIVETTDTTKEQTCPLFILPNQPSTPEIPLKKLENIKPTDTAAIDKLQRDHIAELRRYILKYKQTIKDAHNQYLDKCKK